MYIRNIMLFYVNLVITKINYFAPAIKRSPLSLFLDHFFVVLGGGRGGGGASKEPLNFTWVRIYR